MFGQTINSATMEAGGAASTAPAFVDKDGSAPTAAALDFLGPDWEWLSGEKRL